MNPLNLFAAILVVSSSAALGQGSLLPPPGPPVPTMKTLDQVEPRIIVNENNTPGDAANTFIISAPGSYYLTANITGVPGTHGISIQADDVTLDLNGFALISGGGGDFRGVDVPVKQSGLCIRNGSVRGWTGGGIILSLSATVLAERLSLTGNVGAVGLTVGNGSMVKDCVASGNDTGFFAADRTQLSNCISTVNSSHGFDCTSYVSLIDCTSSRNQRWGIKTFGGCGITRCSSTRNGFDGIFAGLGCTIADCTASNNEADGIRTEGSSVSNCTAFFNVDNGIVANESSVTNSTANYNGFGIITQNGTVMNCTANHNGQGGISAYTGSVANSSASYNGDIGILATSGNVANSSASSNGGTGIYASYGSVTNSFASANGDNGIDAFDGVIAFCMATTNNRNNTGHADIYAPSATRTGNNPTP